MSSLVPCYFCSFIYIRINRFCKNNNTDRPALNLHIYIISNKYARIEEFNNNKNSSVGRQRRRDSRIVTHPQICIFCAWDRTRRGQRRWIHILQLALLSRKCSASSTSTELIENKSTNALRAPLWGHTWDVYGKPDRTTINTVVINWRVF